MKVKRLQNALKKAAEARGEAVILQPSNPDIDPEEMRKKMPKKKSSGCLGRYWW